MAKQNSVLTRDAILGAKDLATEVVEVPEWGGVVHVRSLTGAERDQFEAAVVEFRGTNPQINLKNTRARLVAMTVIDENGKLLFGDGDIEMLGAKSGAALDRVFAVAQRLSGLSRADVDQLAKNFGGGPSAASTSASRTSSG